MIAYAKTMNPLCADDEHNALLSTFVNPVRIDANWVFAENCGKFPAH